MAEEEKKKYPEKQKQEDRKIKNLKYDYYIFIKYKGKDGKLIDIPKENIRTLIINKEYDRYNMPIGTLDLMVDKKLGDTMITDMKESSLHIQVNKYQLDNKAAIQELYFKEEFSYLTTDDISKNREITYMTEKEDKKEKKDEYRKLRLGIISKTLVNSNLHPNNATIYNSRMQDIIADLLNINVPILMEPFDKTEPVSQLIIPPKESIAKTLDYLNTVRVFYNTGYRFFMDFENIFLVSKSGKAVPRVNDIYSTIALDIRTLVDSGALIEGVQVDDTHKRYILTIPSTDVSYVKDTATSMELDGFTAIIDPSKSIQQAYLSKTKGFGGLIGAYKNILSVMDDIKTASKEVRSFIGNIHQVTDQIKGTFIEIKEQAEGVRNVVSDTFKIAKESYLQVPNEVLSGAYEILGVNGTDVMKGNIDVKGILDHILMSSEQMQKLQKESVDPAHDKYKDFKEAYKGQVYHLENFGSLVGSIGPGCFGKNVPELMKQTNQMPGIQKTVNNKYIDSMVKFAQDYGKYVMYNKTLVEEIHKLPDKMTVVVTKDKLNKALKTREVNFKSLKDNWSALKQNLDFSEKKQAQVEKDRETMKKSLEANKAAGKTIEKKVDKSREVPKDFSTQLLEGSNTYVKSLNERITNKRDEYYKTRKDLTGSFNALKTNLSTLYKNGATKVENIKDISKVGSDGESMVDIALDVITIAEDLGKRKILRIPNDNMGLIQNIKHALELRSTNLTVSKPQIDNSIFNINIRYTITSRNVRDGDTGDYILTSKTETYILAGERFMSTTMLSFAKLPEKK